MRFKYLDVLKALAIFAVVLYHSGFLTYGYLGVDLFLVINGYFMTKGLNKLLVVNPSGGGYFQFEISRIARLLPVLLVAGAFCMALGYFVMLPDNYENLSQSVIATNLFGNNILSAITTKNYWDVSNEYKPLMHTWYVGLVMQFYIVYPVLFYIAKLDKKNVKRTLLVIISSLALISLLIYFGTINDAERFYYLPSRFFEFAVGGIIALTWDSKRENNVFHNWFVYVCYVLILLLFCVNQEIISSRIKLVLVVALSAVLIMSSTTLENKVAGNSVFAQIGAASFSIFVWHQVLLAFYRYTISSEFTVATYLVYLIAVAVFSWLTYHFIEQRTSSWLKEKRSKTAFYVIALLTFVGLSGFAGYIYLHAGVVRDVPELYIEKNNIHRGMHAEYCDRAYQYDKPFETDKQHWLVIGNSFGRDFVNVILESIIADKVEVSYIYENDYKKRENAIRFNKANRVFVSSKGISEELIESVEVQCLANGCNPKNLIVVGDKNFGISNGQFYVKRGLPDYFDLRTNMEYGYAERNEHLRSKYRERYIDLIGLVVDEKGTMPVFTPDHHYISQDCRHFSKGGAKWFASLIDWELFLD